MHENGSGNAILITCRLNSVICICDVKASVQLVVKFCALTAGKMKEMTNQRGF